MIAAPVWSDDEHFRVDDVEFVYSSGESTVSRFCIRKPRRLVEMTVELVGRFEAPRVFEIGIARGGSTALIALVARPRRLVAVELDADRVGALDELIARRDLGESVRAFYGVDQSDRSRLAAIADEQFGDDPLDLVIDDASHRLDETRASFEVLFPRLRAGGAYVIEDWNWQLELAYALAERAGTPAPAPAPVAADGAAAIAFRAYVRENARQTPLEMLALELVLARACSGHAVDKVVVGEHWVVVTRGPGELSPHEFRLAANYVGGSGLLARGEG
jgi:predicted O-methyltransferase YrrM